MHQNQCTFSFLVYSSTFINFAWWFEQYSAQYLLNDQRSYDSDPRQHRTNRVPLVSHTGNTEKSWSNPGRLTWTRNRRNKHRSFSSDFESTRPHTNTNRVIGEEARTSLYDQWILSYTLSSLSVFIYASSNATEMTLLDPKWGTVKWKQADSNVYIPPYMGLSQCVSSIDRTSNVFLNSKLLSTFSTSMVIKHSWLSIDGVPVWLRREIWADLFLGSESCLITNISV